MLDGLTSNAAAICLERDGPNELPGHAPRGLMRIAREVLTEPMFLLLLAAAAIYMALGDLGEALALAASLIVVLSITILQERRTEHALARLRDLSSPRALVIRDGVEQRIPGRNVVVGDLVILHEGDRVPADGLLCDATGLAIDESLLTGESLAAEKSAPQSSAVTNDEKHRVYSGSLVVRGFGTARITATGAQSEFGKIGGALAALVPEVTPLFREVRRIVKWVAVAGVLLCACIAILYAVTRHDWLGGVLAGITLAMGVVPEEFPVVLTVFLAMGAWRISRAGVLTRTMPAVESIGAATVLAVDKTGTLTENTMQVTLLEAREGMIDLRLADSHLDAGNADILFTAFQASERDAFDPMERAIHTAARRSLPQRVADTADQSLIREYDLTSELLAVTHVWQSPKGAEAIVAVKGAPETVFDLCRIKNSERAALAESVAAHAQSGFRVLAVATGTHSAASLPESARGFALHLLGLICLADPLRSEVPSALAECKAAGIRVVMITGDHPGTALAIASQAGFDTGSGVLTGHDIEALDEHELRLRVRDVNIYARAKPEHKLRLVAALKANGEIVAMTGDGVNDAPALKAAHIGVAMGERGTDVAREAAALVLVKDDFASLVAAVRLGRRIYENIRHAMSFIVAVHVPIAGLGLLPVLFGWPLLFFPMHVLFLEFVIDPACALVFEADAESSDIMHRKPRRPSASLFSRALLKRSLTLGFAILAFETALYGIALALTSAEQARALAFVGLVVANLALIFVSRSRSENFATLYARSNKVFWWIVAAASTALAIAVFLAPVALLFKFAPPSAAAVSAVIAAAISIVLLAGRFLRLPRQTF
jgi:Ca2+-transporting ATPase